MEAREREQRFEQLAQARASHLHSTAYLLVGSWPAAQDLVQEALVATWLGLHRVEDPEALEAYARTILVRKAMRWRQRVRDREVVVSDPPDRRSDDSTASVDDRDELRRQLFRLAPRERAMVVLRYYENLSEPEVADIFGCPVGTVKSTTSRALRRIRPSVVAPEPAQPPAPAAVPRPARIPGPVVQAALSRTVAFEARAL
jgi:RNA polymerase sigma-70 factor (sigma-E family)